MKFFKMMKAAALIAEIFSDEEKVKEMIAKYYIETGKKITVEEAKENGTPECDAFAEWVSEKVLEEL